MRLYPRTRWAKLLVKAPLIAWRLGLGPITGKLFLVLTTTGRKSGLPRHTMVEYHVLEASKYTPCAFGSKAQYYQNIVADPRVTIQSADGTEHALAVRVTDDDELIAVFELFKRRDPLLLEWYLKSLGIKPKVLEVDLAWLWLVGLVGLLVMQRVRSLLTPASTLSSPLGGQPP